MRAEVGGNMRISQGHRVYSIVPDTALCSIWSSAVSKKKKRYIYIASQLANITS